MKRIRPLKNYTLTRMNRNRAKWVRAALDAFARETGQRVEDEAPEVIGDMLADLMHFCRQYGLDFNALLEAGREHFAAEFLGEVSEAKAWKAQTARLERRN